ncbi:hypothetical protein [Candidatus Caldatribacterium sp.]|uniref:hypothetical protein n=1 Tax=Candidatus Caldatribacterium sp. TaxID=2282143 RepID=UPI00383FBF76|nr:hypothetical protein [Candidatus Caldatribacterium sp.]
MGIPTIEHFFQWYITNYFDFLRRNPYFVDYILNTADLRLKDWARKTVQYLPVPCYFVFPKPNVKPPFIVISVATEMASVNYLGDRIGMDYPIREKEVTGEVITFYGNEAQVKNFPLKHLTIFEDGRELPEDRYLVDHYRGRIVLTDQPQPNATYTASYVYFQNYGEELVYLNSYDVSFDVLSVNVDEVVLIHRLLHHLFLSDRTYLAGLGMKNQVISCGEIVPQYLSDQPEPLYSRTLRFSFEMETSGMLSHRVIISITV